VKRECALCGRIDDSVHPAVVRWLDGEFASALRCDDRVRCRQFCEAGGDEWPVIDGLDMRRAILETAR